MLFVSIDNKVVNGHQDATCHQIRKCGPCNIGGLIGRHFEEMTSMWFGFNLCFISYFILYEIRRKLSYM